GCFRGHTTCSHVRENMDIVDVRDDLPLRCVRILTNPATLPLRRVRTASEVAQMQREELHTTCSHVLENMDIVDVRDDLPLRCVRILTNPATLPLRRVRTASEEKISKTLEL